MKSILCDYIIAGSGVAGLASAIYAARGGLDVVALDFSEAGGQALNIFELENYPGVFPALSGADFIASLQKQAKAFGVKIAQAKIQSVDKINDLFHARAALPNGEENDYAAPAFLIATGASHDKLGVAGESELYGKGVSYCATCDGPFFKGKKIVAVGGGNSACAESLYLATLSPQVTLVHRRGNFRAEQTLIRRVKHNKNIAIRYNTIIKEIRGRGRVESVLLENVETHEQNEFQTDSVFIFVGMKPRTELFDFLPKDERGFILTNEKMETLVPGLYCAGDVRSKPLRQIVTAVSDGAIAAHEAALYVQNIKNANGAKGGESE